MYILIASKKKMPINSEINDNGNNVIALCPLILTSMLWKFIVVNTCMSK